MVRHIVEIFGTKMVDKRQNLIDHETRVFLDSNKIGRLGTTDLTGQPLVVPICYAVSADCIYSVIDDKPKNVKQRELKRIRNIRKNPKVCLTVDVYSHEWSTLGFVLVQGYATILSSGPDHYKASELLKDKYLQYTNMDFLGRPMIRISPTKIFKWGRLLVN